VCEQHQSFLSSGHTSRQLLNPSLQSKGKLTSSEPGDGVANTDAAVVVAVALSPVVEVLVAVEVLLVVVVLDVEVVDVEQPTCSLVQHHHACVSDQDSGTCTRKILSEPSGSHSSSATPEA